MAKIGFVGVGNMGGPMAINLIKAGHEVTCYDLSSAAVDKVVGAGGKAASSATDAVDRKEIVITMLPKGEHVRAVYLGEDGLIQAAEEGTLFIDSSTIDVATARDVAKVAQDAGMMMIDAPVSGGVGGAEGGTLTFMCGGSDAAFEKAKPILDVMGGKIVHAGGAGNGQVAKICNNMVLGISMLAAGEAFTLAEKLGLDAQTFFDIVSTSSGYCWSINVYCPVPGPVPTSPANRDYQPGFSAENMLKDLRLSQQAAEQSGVDTHMGHEAMALYERFAEAMNQGGKDFSGIIRMIQEKSGG
ncbi:MAG: 3-hydroxyisobutyrate dehydrogenase [Rhizobiales bacterium NRL2]|jgi:3-hydroxyisobutyrate dehydrogenase|nr:MAG: 3-hydroxyisobutyrate dehydrogenase [Rhizobiales bacterium NRL2]